MAGIYFTSFDEAKIYYHKTEKDPNKWLIFLHGFGGDLTAWNKEIDYFSKLGISTLALDLRGHGLSDRSNDKSFYNLENFVKDIITLMKQEQISHPVVVGHCFGGMITIFLGAKFPHLAKGLVLVDTSYKPPFIGENFTAKAFFDQIINLLLKFAPDLKQKGHVDFNKFKGSADLDAKRILSDILHTSLRTYLMLCDNLVKLDAKALLNKILVPTLVIEGTKDSIFPPDVAEYLSRRIKNSELDLIEGANHILVLNNPEDLSKNIEVFLKKIKFI